MKLFNYRKFYKKDSLSIDDVGDNPLEFFRRWFEYSDNSDEIIEKNGKKFSTFSIIKCTSNSLFETLLIFLRISGPKEIFGTK